MAVANRTGGAINLTMFGKNLKTKEIDLYQILITTGDPITFSIDSLSGGNYSYQTVHNKAGKIIGRVQLDEEDPNGEISFSILEDFDYLNDKHLIGNSKNIMLNLLNGEAFYNNEGDIIVPVGTNGTDKTKTAQASYREMNKPYKYLLYNEGGFIRVGGTADNETGEIALQRNPFADSFNQAFKTFCMEFQTTTGQGQVDRMFPILAKSSAEWAEGDINQFNLTAQRGCDMIERDAFYTEIYKEGYVIPKDKSHIKELFVDYIIEDTATISSIKAKEGDLYLNLKSDGDYEIMEFKSSAWKPSQPIKDKVALGTRFKTNKLILKKDNKVKNVNTFAVIGLKNKLVDFSSDNSNRNYCIVKDYDKTEGKFVDYVTE